MLITCNNCETIFQIEKSKINSKGQQVRCSVCAHVWTVLPEEDDKIARPKLDLSRNKNVFTEDTTNKTGNLKLRQDIPINKEKKHVNLFAWLIGMLAISAMLLALIYASIIYRTTVTAYFPAITPIFKMAGLNIRYSSENLIIEDLQINWKEDILRVRGNIRNISLMRIHTLPLRISVMDPSGLLLSTHEIWPDKAIIDASSSVPFFAQITIDADEKAEIEVDFLQK